MRSSSSGGAGNLRHSTHSERKSHREGPTSPHPPSSGKRPKSKENKKSRSFYSRTTETLRILLIYVRSIINDGPQRGGASIVEQSCKIRNRHGNAIIATPLTAWLPSQLHARRTAVNLLKFSIFPINNILKKKKGTYVYERSNRFLES